MEAIAPFIQGLHCASQILNTVLGPAIFETNGKHPIASSASTAGHSTSQHMSNHSWNCTHLTQGYIGAQELSDNKTVKELGTTSGHSCLLISTHATYPISSLSLVFIKPKHGSNTMNILTFSMLGKVFAQQKLVL